MSDQVMVFNHVFQAAAVATANGTAMNVGGLPAVGVQIAGITSATITFEGIQDGSNWVAVQAINRTTGAKGTTATADGLYLVPTAGLDQLRVRISTWVSGAITVTGKGVLNAAEMSLALMGIDQTTPGASNGVYSAPAPQTPTAYRTGLTAIDTLAAVGTVTCTKIAGAGLTAGAYITNVVAVNAFGRGIAKVGSATITTETTNLRINAAFAQVPGATHYDIYCTTVAALWSGRITEAQRAAGVLLSTLGAGSAINSVDIDVIGTGLAGSLAAINTAYVIPASPVVCTGYMNVDFHLTCSRTGDAVAPALTVAPAFLNARDSTYSVAAPVALTFGSMKQVIRVDARGYPAVALLITAIAGTGMSVVVEASRS